MSETVAPGPVPLVRVVHGAVAIDNGRAPYDTAHFRIHYPALWTGTDTERLTGVLPADDSLAPWPLAIVLPGINVGSDGYRWLARSLAHAGIATLTFDLVEQVMPGSSSLSPGLDITAVGPDSYGTRPSANALAALLSGARAASAAPPLEGRLDSGRFVLIGHSAGGTVALENANPSWFPGLRGVVTYGAHTMPAVMLGHPEGTVLPMPGRVPALVIAGTEDGVIRASADRYRAGTAHDPVRRTFREACTHPASRLVELEGANHMVMIDNEDSTTARGFLDAAPTAESRRRDGETRCLIAGMVTAFARAVLNDGDIDLTALDQFANHGGIGSWEAQ